MEEDDYFVYGRILKANTARALRRAELSTDHISRLRRRIVKMLHEGNVPQEFREYAKLLRKIGLGDYRSEVEEILETANPYVQRYCNYLLSKTPEKRAKIVRI